MMAKKYRIVKLSYPGNAELYVVEKRVFWFLWAEVDEASFASQEKAEKRLLAMLPPKREVVLEIE